MTVKIWTTKPAAKARTILPLRGIATSSIKPGMAWPGDASCQVAPRAGGLPDCLHGAGCLVLSSRVRSAIESFYAAKKAASTVARHYDFLHATFLPVRIVDGTSTISTDYTIAVGTAAVNVIDLAKSKLVWRNGRPRGVLEKVNRLAIRSGNVHGLEHGEYLPWTVLFVDAELRKRFADEKLTGMAYQDVASFKLDLTAATKKPAKVASPSKKDAAIVARATKLGASSAASIAADELAAFAGKLDELADEAWYHGGAQAFEGTIAGDSLLFSDAATAFKTAFVAALPRSTKPKPKAKPKAKR